MTELYIYFSDEINKILSHANIDISLDVKYYLENLLLEKLTDTRKEYLIDLYQESINASSKEEAYSKFKYLGDHSLITSGFFNSSIKHVSVDYYVGMGKMAYYRISSLGVNDTLFKRLYGEYEQCCSILYHIGSSNNIYEQYNFWKQTDCSISMGKMIAAGFMPMEIKE